MNNVKGAAVYETPFAKRPLPALNSREPKHEEHGMTEIDHSFQRNRNQENVTDSASRKLKGKCIKYALAIFFACVSIAISVFLGIMVFQLLKNVADLQRKLELVEENIGNEAKEREHNLELIKKRINNAKKVLQHNLELVEEKNNDKTKDLQRNLELVQLELEERVSNQTKDMRESYVRDLTGLKKVDLQLQSAVKELKYFNPKDCSEVSANDFLTGNKARGVFGIVLEKRNTTHSYCDLQSDGGRWTVIQRRMDGSVNFYRGINDYVTGFGNISGEFWFGLENIYIIVERRKFEMRIDLEDWNGVKKFAKYSFFGIGNRHEDYRLNISGYSGTAGDAMAHQNGQRFSSKDHDVDSREKENCAQKYNGSWWYGICHHSNLNGLYLKGRHVSYANGINWKQWKGHHYSLRFVEMKIRPIA